jgi:hypothetical protein
MPVISNEQYMLPLSTKKNQKSRKGLRQKGLAQPHYSMQHIEGYDMLCYKDNKQDLHSSIIEKEYKEYCPSTMNIYLIRDRLEQKRLSGMPWHCLVLHKMLSMDWLCYTCQVYQMTKKESKKYCLLQPKLTESDPWVMVCVNLAGPLKIMTQANKHSLLEIIEATNKSATFIQDLFHIT